jgi:hypothetical protein
LTYDKGYGFEQFLIREADLEFLPYYPSWLRWDSDEVGAVYHPPDPDNTHTHRPSSFIVLPLQISKAGRNAARGWTLHPRRPAKKIRAPRPLRSVIPRSGCHPPVETGGETGAAGPGSKTTLRQVSIVVVHNNNKDGLRVAFLSEALDGPTMVPDRAMGTPRGTGRDGTLRVSPASNGDIPDHRGPN